jgi:hypothetical protein
MRGLITLRELVGRRAPDAPLASLRMVLAGASLLQLAEIVPVLEELGDPDLIRTPYLAHVTALPAWAPAVLTAVWAGAGLAALLGWRAWAATQTLALVHVATLFYDRQLYSNHFYFLTILSVLLALAQPRDRDPGAIPAWPLFLMRTQLSSVYLFAGLSKIQPEFLSGRVLQHYMRDTLLPGREQWYRLEVLGWVAVAVAFTEVFLAAGLWIPRVRHATLTTGFLFHVSILVALGPSLGLVIFAVESLGVYPLFAPCGARGARGVRA